MPLRFDEIGEWSELKIEIVKKYASAYASILSAQRPPFRYCYIDAFSGPGEHRRKKTGERIWGTPIEVLAVKPGFHEYYFVDLDISKIDYLLQQIGTRPDVHTFVGDANDVLPQRVYPEIKYDEFRRGLCLLDPYGLDLNWTVIEAAGKSKSIEIFLNFPTTDMQRNVFWRNPEGVDPADIKRMNMYWGDESWRDVAYRMEEDLFGPRETKSETVEVVNAFRRRLKEKAGFQFVPEPIPMRNSTGAIVYYLFFASQNQTGARIANDIFKGQRS